MKNALWKACFGGAAVALFCVATCTQSFAADARSLEEMEKELNVLKASVQNLTEQIESVKREKVVATSSPYSTKDDVEALKKEVTTLKDELKIAAQAETMKAEDLVGNVYSSFAKKVQLGAQIRTRAEYANGFYNVPASLLSGASGGGRIGGATTGEGTSVVTESSPRGSIDDNYVLNRTRLWADADVNEHLRMFIQIQDSRSFGVEGTTVGFATSLAGDPDNRIDLHQAYFDVKNLFDLPLTVRVGRQEIIWGDHRVIGNFIWSNVGRTFDGGRFMWDTEDIHAEVFGVTLDEDGFVGEDDNTDQSLYAAMLGFKRLIPNALLELMFIHSNDQDQDSNLAVANGFVSPGDESLLVYDVGARLDGRIPNIDAWDYTLEAHGQFGDFGGQTHRAWAFAGRTGYTFKEVAWTPRLGIEYDFASGDDDPGDSLHETFDNLFPTNHWQGNYGFIDLVGWRNIHDFRANLKVKPTAKLTAQVDGHWFFLDEPEDGWYFASGALAAARPAVGAEFASNDRNLAQEIDLTVAYDLYKNVKLLAGYSVFLADDWIDDTFGDEIDTHWGYIQTTVTF